MSTLALVRTPDPQPPARPKPPVAVGDIVRVPSALTRPCGRKIRRDSYEVLEVLYGPDLPEPFRRPSWRLVIETEMDCSGLGDRFRKPTARERMEAAREGIELVTPFAAEPHRLFLDAGDYIRLTDDQDVSIPDHPLQND